jgi:1,4-dihydroxy-2-naphthoyl-CoA hydrolase|tara:strand:+ start:5072 stop:5449 length:378 start_codon:yes stop_codon:yes gene_type:complete
MNKGTIGEHLEILMTEVGDDYITGTMPADARTFQPYGVVHGGANVVLAESLGSIAGAHVIDFATSKCLGQEVSASHLRPVSSGLVTGTARPIHLGRRSHIWEIRLTNDEGKLTCISKLTLAIISN